MEIKELTYRAIEIRKKYAELEKKENRKGWGKEQTMEGLVSDVGDLMKLVMAREGFRKIDETNSKLAHELSDCLWCILVLASEYGIDIERSFIEEMNKLGSKTS